MRPELTAALDLARNLPTNELPEFLGALETVRTTARARLATPTVAPKGSCDSKPRLPVPISPTDLLTPEELASRLKVAPSWVFEQTRARWKIRNKDKPPLPVIRIEKYLRFSWVQVCEWLAAQNNR